MSDITMTKNDNVLFFVLSVVGGRTDAALRETDGGQTERACVCNGNVAEL